MRWYVVCSKLLSLLAIGISARVVYLEQTLRQFTVKMGVQRIEDRVMKTLRFMSLAVLVSAMVQVYGQPEKRDEKQAKPEKQQGKAEPQQRSQAPAQHAQPQPRQQQEQHAQQPAQHAQPQPRQPQEQHAQQPTQHAQPQPRQQPDQRAQQQQQRAQHQQPAQQGDRSGQNRSYAPPERSRQQAQTWQQQSGWRQHGGWQGQSTWQQDRSSHWESDHRTWGQRGGYGGYYIPLDRFSLRFGEGHWFRIQSQPI